MASLLATLYASSRTGKELNVRGNEGSPQSRHSFTFIPSRLFEKVEIINRSFIPLKFGSKRKKLPEGRKCYLHLGTVANVHS